MNNKRDDLQWLRALAIIAVFAFHLIPDKFPYGYLGVDIFFVLSGYLMTVILSKNDNLLQFYASRIKRIFPVFSFVITIIFIVGYFVFLPSDYNFFKTEVIWSIFFINNMYPIFHKKQYFELIAEYKFLLHTWSLGVEIQYYLIAPFLIKFILSKKQSIYWTLLIMIGSFLFQHLTDDEAVSFGFVFSRIWQFLFGTLAYICCQHHILVFRKNKRLKTASMMTFICIIIILCFNSTILSRHNVFRSIIRTLSVVLSSIFIALNTSQQIYLPNAINIILVYIGDLSYIFYLVHWPIIALFQYSLGSIHYMSIIVITTIFTIIIHHGFEICIRKYKAKAQFYCILFFYVIILVFCSIKNNSRKPLLNPIEENEKAAELCQRLYYDNCEPDQLLENFTKIETLYSVPIKYCSYKLDESAKKVIIIMGNSYAYFQNRGLLEAVKEAKTKFKKAYFITLSGCTFVAGRFNKKYICKGYFKAFYDLLKAVKPDVILNTAKYELLIPYNITETNFTDEDIYYKELKKNILNVAKYTSRLIILQPNPLFPCNAPSTIQSPLTVAHALKNNQSTTKFVLSEKIFHKMHNPSWNRIKKAAEYCSNCLVVPTEHLFCANGICPMVDQKTQIAMYCDNNHLTAEKSLSLKPDVIKAVDENAGFNKK